MKKVLFILGIVGTILVIVCVVLFAFEKVEDRPKKDLYINNIYLTKLIFIGDNGSGKDSEYQVAQAIQKNCTVPSCGGVFVVGDDIYKGGVKSVNDPQFVSKFEKPYQSINVPFYMALGNHDYRGCVNCYLKYADKNRKFVLPSTYYTVHFNKLINVFVIDTERFIFAQQKWLKTELAKSTAQWKIVAGHRPVKSYADVFRWEDAFHVHEMNVLKTIICKSANYYVSGHTHALEYPGPIHGCTVRQVVSGGGGVTDLHPKIKNAPDIFYKETFGLVKITVSPDKLSAQFIDGENRLLFQLP
jgi:tartrate-resistant acid phosphatase type 5